MAGRAVTALFDSHEDAARVVDRIEAEGVPHAEIGIVSLKNDGPLPPTTAEPGPARSSEAEAADGAGAGATVGTVLGGGAGLLAGLGLIAIPGIGPIVAAGWLITALSGAGVGAAAGGLIGALTGAGLSGTDAETYAEGVRRGGTLVTVRADQAHAARVMDILEEHGSIDVDERAQNWRAEGWTAPQAAAATSPDAIPGNALGGTVEGRNRVRAYPTTPV